MDSISRLYSEVLEPQAHAPRLDQIRPLLDTPLESSSPSKPNAKRVRLSSIEPRNDTIRRKIESSAYTSIPQVLQDIESKKAKLSGSNDSDTDGNDGSTISQDAIEAFIARLSSTERGTDGTVQNSPSKGEGGRASLPAGRIITLRSQTEKGPQQLYSGLPQAIEYNNNSSAEIDGRRLPNGFDLSHPTTVDPGSLAPLKEKRTIGDVFRPLSRSKALELPRNTRSAFKGNTLGFVSEPSLERTSSLNRSDYKYQQLPTGSWLTYNKETNETDLLRKQRERTLGGTDFRTVLMANELVGNDAEDPTMLFRKAFSSFAPTSDSARALISEQHRDRQWWQKNGRKRLRKVFKTEYPDLESTDNDAPLVGLDEKSLESLVQTFEDAEDSPMPALGEDVNTITEVLTEVSQLLETVHSYQNIRKSDTKIRNEPLSPSTGEYDTYEILKSQLSILVASLPPFAVAKLDGDKLADLNISTSIIVETTDYRGTGQTDDYTQSRYRAAHAASTTNAATTRPAQPAQPRQNYQTPNILGRYGTNAQSYSSNMASLPGATYASRPTNYQTPAATTTRPYQSTAYQSAAGSYSQPTVQQFQRPTQNGYGNYSTPQQQAGYSQTPSQPAYQQRAQTQPLVYGRTESPQKPVVNAGHYGQPVTGR